MNIKEFKDYLENIPDDYDIELGKIIVSDVISDDETEDYTVILDFPIWGIAVREKDKHCRLIFGSKDLNKDLIEKHYGKMERI